MASLTSAFLGAHITALPPVSKSRRGHRTAIACKERRSYGVASRIETRRWNSIITFSRSRSALICAAQLPSGVDAPSEEPRLPPSLWGFTETAEVWNSRVAMIGLVGLLGLELIAGKGLLEMIGVEVGKGLDLPL